VSNRSLVLVIVAAAIAFAVGRYAQVRAPGPSAEVGACAQQDEAAKAASRAMTFTQPKATAQ
jgi:cytochrome c-type biogenesis protein CcmH/NrfG